MIAALDQLNQKTYMTCPMSNVHNDHSLCIAMINIGCHLPLLLCLEENINFQDFAAKVLNQVFLSKVI